MNNLICGNQRPDKIAASVEEIVRKDVASAGPIVYRIAGGDAAPASLASVLTDIGNVLGSGSTTPLLTVEVDPPGPRPASLTARMLRQGVGCYCGTLLFTVTLGRPIGGEVTIEDHKSFGSPGSPAARQPAASTPRRTSPGGSTRSCEPRSRWGWGDDGCPRGPRDRR